MSWFKSLLSFKPTIVHKPKTGVFACNLAGILHRAVMNQLDQNVLVKLLDMGAAAHIEDAYELHDGKLRSSASNFMIPYGSTPLNVALRSAYFRQNASRSVSDKLMK